MRDLTIDVRVNTAEAKRNLGALEAALASAKQEAKGAGDRLDDLIGLMNKAGGAAKTQLGAQVQQAGEELAVAKAKVKEFGDELKKLSGDQKEGTQTQNAFTAAIGRFLTGAAILGAIKSTTEFANNLQRMSSQTGLGTDALQELNYASKLVNVSMDSVTTSISMMERRLAENGDKGAIGAVRHLGLNIDELRVKGPEAFFDIAAAVNALPDPFERAKVAQEIFGRGGASLLPVFENLEKIRLEAHDVGAVMDRETVKAMGDLNNAVDTLTLHGKTLIGAILVPMSPALLAIANAAQTAVGWFAQLAAWGRENGPLAYLQHTMSALNALRTGNVTVPDAPNAPGAKMQAPLAGGFAFDEDNKQSVAMLGYLAAAERTVTDAVREQIRTRKEAEQVAKLQRVAEEHALKAALNAEYDQIQFYRHETIAAHEAISKGFLASMPVLMNLAVAMGDVRLAGKQLNTEVLGLMPDLSQQAAQRMYELRDGVLAWGSVMRNVLGDIPRLITSAFTGGGGLGGALKALSSQVGSQLFGEGGPLGFGAGGMLSGLGNKLTGMFGGALGLALPGIGGALGSLIGPALSGLKHLFGGPSQEELQGRSTIADFEKQLGSMLTATQKLEAGGQRWKETTIAVRDAYLATGRSSAEAELAVKQLWDSSKLGAAATKEAIDQINAVLQEQQRDQARAKELIDEYKISIDQLGPSFRAQQLNEQAKGVMDDFRLMVNVLGIDAPVAMDLMKDKISEFVQRSIKAGFEVPASMRPMLEQMASMGLLTDASGDKITDLQGAGVTFAETLTQGVDRIVAKFDELMKKLGLLPTAMNNVPDFNMDVNLNAHWNIPEIPARDVEFVSRGGLVTNAGIQYFAGGGRVLPFRGSDVVPAMLTPGEGVLNRGAMRRIGGAASLHRLNTGGGAASSGPAVNVIVNVDGYIDSPKAQRQLAKIVDDHVMQQLRLRGRAS